MIWNLLLAHLLGDFPLQIDWIALRKSNFWVLILHVSIHFVLMVLLVGPSRDLVWPFLLLLSLVHMVQDRLKIFLTDRWPSRMLHLFYTDQLLHIAAILGLVFVIQTSNPNIPQTQYSAWVIIAIAFLMVTFVWYISERVNNAADIEYLKNIEETKISRMLVRSGFVSIFLLVRTWGLPGLSSVFASPYPPSIYRKRAVITDISVSFLVITFLLLTLEN
jgi:hypothetical protein